jgi:hypothetical protein
MARGEGFWSAALQAGMTDEEFHARLLSSHEYYQNFSV